MSVIHVSCDRAGVRHTGENNRVARPRLVIAATILASTLAFVDGSVVNVALPTLGASLPAGPAGLQWIINAYLLPLGALLLLGGAASDRFGSRRLLVLGVGIFGVASIACAMAQGLTSLLVARFVQGISAAMLMPSSLGILGQSFSGEAKGRAVGIWAAAGAGGGAVGPVVGGWLIDAGSWRFIFLINVPIAIAAIALAYLSVDNNADDESEPLDIPGAILATAGLGLLTWALTEGSGTGWSNSVLVAAVGGSLLLTAFVFVERARGSKAMMPLVLFSSSGFVGLTIITFLLYGALGGLLVLTPYVLIKADGYTAVQSGAALLPLPLLIALASPAAGTISGRTGPRWFLSVGPLVVAGGFLLALRIGSGNGYSVDVLPMMIVIAIGMAAAVAPLTTAILMSVDDRHVGAASGLNSAVARIGGLAATALIGPVIGEAASSFLTRFDIAAVIGSLLCLGAALSAFILVPPSRSRSGSVSQAR